MYLAMQDEEQQAQQEKRLNAPSEESERQRYKDGYLSGINDARALGLQARTKEFKHEALDWIDEELLKLLKIHGE